MIKSFRHRGLKRLYERGDRSKINPQQVDRIELILADLDVAETIDDMRVPGYRLHELSGNLREFYAISVSGNWCITFKFEGSDASDINLVDYH